MKPDKDTLRQAVDKAKEAAAKPGVSFEMDDGALAELVFDPSAHQTAFAVYRDGQCSIEKELVVRGRRYRPYSPENNLLAHEVVLLPSGIEEYGTEAELLECIRAYIHRFVDVTESFERLASCYALFSWVYDAFNELPYLRARGDYGSGKTRLLVTLGSICFKPIFASGASTVSPLFRILDIFRGTLIVDESDLRWSDERAEFVKILNNGNARGFPVLRSEATPQGEYNPRAYTVFGPKIVASRGVFDDKALESRFLTEEMGLRRPRPDVPVNLPPEQKTEALRLRNQLLLFRFRKRHRLALQPDRGNAALEPRINQIFTPLLSVIDDADVRKDLMKLAQAFNRDLKAERSSSVEAQALGIVRDLMAKGVTPLSVKTITEAFIERHGQEFERGITTRWMGGILRHRLHLKTRKSHGVFVIPPGEVSKLRQMYERYDVNSNEESTL